MLISLHSGSQRWPHLPLRVGKSPSSMRILSQLIGTRMLTSLEFVECRSNINDKGKFYRSLGKGLNMWLPEEVSRLFVLMTISTWLTQSSRERQSIYGRNSVKIILKVLPEIIIRKTATLR